MEIKHPIHLRRMDCIKPSMKPNEEASTYFSRIEVDFQNAKMSTCLANNLLTHVTLNSIPDTDTFKKQREHLSTYLSQLGKKKGDEAIADPDSIRLHSP